MERKADLFVNIFAHNGVVGICVDCEPEVPGEPVTHLPEAVINDPAMEPVFKADVTKVRVSETARALMETCELSESKHEGGITLEVTPEGTKMFGWCGGLTMMFKPEDCPYTGVSDKALIQDFAALPADYEIPQGFIDAAEEISKAQ